jgi:chromosome segregation ATPase
VGNTLEMEILIALKDYIIWILGAITSYFIYQNQKAETARRLENEKLNNRIVHLEKELHRLDKSQAEIAIQIREIKEDIGYIRAGLDTIIARI